jgi:hypothetical protein
MFAHFQRHILATHARRISCEHINAAPLPNDPQAVRTSRPRHQLCIAVGAAVLAVTLTACGPTRNIRRGVDPHAIPAVTGAPDADRLPDLNDPAVRKQFACSFAEGYFTPPQPPPKSPSDCR